ncbi:CoA-binding protein [Rubinisphaera sp.]|uniref:CoA-binding protein n=1 Tax=Rubinisphaera sp. TaxID=2024857 RepID=UPI000C117ED0|nr:CoA-binding protein [Rubinisphaera sp.]MBV08193.1 CoA-binding protein [Rubinisphaera sp.]HCS53113.1 CoA-binding protein [Planctomycetaceae bacterium]
MEKKQTVAILGASQDRSKYGNKSVRAHLTEGYEVYPINPKANQIEGLTCYASLSEVPSQELDRISVYLPPAIGLKLLPEIQAAKAKEVWFNPGSESPELMEQARAMGINVIQACSIVDVGRMPDEFSE